MNEDRDEIHLQLQGFIPIADGIVQTFGKYCEVAVHDLRNPETSLIYVAGSITHRQKGAPITNIVLENIRQYGQDSKDIIGYKNVTRDGHILKSSTIFIRDHAGKIIGCLCINYDITELLIHKAHLEELAIFGETPQTGNESELFASDITEVLDAMINQVINNIGIPVTLMQKEDKIQVVRGLDLKGVFMIKGAVDKVAVMLGVSRYTIYNYLEEDRSSRVHNII